MSTGEIVIPRYAHRQHRDGSWDSICLNCYLTVVASTGIESADELAAYDSLHICNVSKNDAMRLGTVPSLPPGMCPDAVGCQGKIALSPGSSPQRASQGYSRQTQMASGGS